MYPKVATSKQLSCSGTELFPAEVLRFLEATREAEDGRINQR